MFNNLGFTSDKKESKSFDTPISLYFPFGQEREKLKSYVFEQLHGNEALKNAEILNKFREEAAVRRHRYLHHISYTEQPQQMLRNPANNQQAHTSFPILNHDNNYYRFANYLPKQYHRYSLIPTQKTPPPIYNLASLDNRIGLQTKRKQTKISFNPKTPFNMHQTIKNEFKLDNNRPYHQRRSQSLDIRHSYKDKALTKIKQIARQKKKDFNKSGSIYSTDSSQILQQLQYKKEVSKIQYKHLQKQVKKFNKYRNYLKKNDNYNF